MDYVEREKTAHARNVELLAAGPIGGVTSFDCLVKEWLAEWQERLSLRHWEIRIEVRRARDMSIPKARATSEYWLATSSGYIEILDPIDYPAEPTFPFDPEIDVVHELLHFHFAPFRWGDDDEAARIAQEQAIHAISKALVALKRLTKS